MAKVMLVEDDNNLREIYEARLAAEGYEIVSAQDGEEALALAVKERPDLIIADIMMPKVSGFDMLDILRSTPETKGTKIIMMTALSQAEDKARAEKLGADKYLVKSQVTLEDVVKVAGEMLNGDAGANKAADADLAATSGAVVSQPSAPSTPTTSDVPVATPPSNPPADDKPSGDAVAEPPKADEPADDTTTPAPAKPPKDDTSADEPATVLVTPPPEKPAGEAPQEEVPVKTEEPKQEPAVQPAPAANPTAKLGNTTAEEEAQISQQIEEFINKNPTLSTAASEAGAKPAITPQDSKATSIPVTTPNETSSTNTEADQTMANAVNNLAGNPTEKPEEPKKLPNAIAEPETAKEKVRKGGERVIQPISDGTPPGPSLEELLAKEGESGQTPPPANAVITPDGNTLTSATGGPAPTVPQDVTPGNVISGTPPTPNDPNHPNNIAL